MRRWLILLMLVVLPLQSSWSVAAAYCAHEGSGEAAHAGHHEHEHAAAAKAQPDAAKASPLLGDGDCGVCHLSAARPAQVHAVVLPLLGHSPPRDTGVPPLRTRDPDRLERPNWRLA